MNLLLIVDDYLPHSTKIAAKMMHELAIGFSNSGHNVTLLTPRPSSIISSFFEQYRKFKLEKFEDISVIRFPSGRIKNVNKIFRLINEILLPCRAWNYAKSYLASIHFDLVVDYSPSIFWAPLVEKIKKQQNCKSYLILRDFFPQWAIDARILQENSLLTKYFQFVEQKNYSIADKIGIQSPGNIEIFLRKNFKWKDKIQLLYNWADTNKEISIINDRTYSFRQRFKLEGKVVFFYGGNIGKAQEMMNLLVLADRMFHYSKDAFFIFLGEGDEVTIVKNYIASKKLTNSLYLPSVNQLEFQEILKSIDVGLFSLHPSHTSNNFPGKLLGYMQNAKPILGCVNIGNDLYETFSKSNSGYISYSGDINTLFSNANKLMNKEERIRIGQNSFQLLLDQFSTESAVSTILKNYSIDTYQLKNSKKVNTEYIRRHSLWYEQIILSYVFQFLAGVFVLISFSAIPIWGFRFWELEDPNIFTSLITCVIAFLLATLTLRNVFRLPGSQTVGYVLPVTTIYFAIPILYVLIFRTSYSIQVFIVSYVVALAWCYLGFFIGKRYRIVRYALLPFGEVKELNSAHGAMFEVLRKPNLEGQRYNAVLADFNNKKLTPEWEKFLAQCTLSRIPVYSIKRIRESLLGRVKIAHLSENEFGSLLPSSSYEILKRWIDLLTAFVILPILIPFFIILAMIIRFESHGSIFFIQERMGYRGKVFKMIKFRSMFIDRKGSGFTNPEDDPRITKVGRIIRKFRIDELPQVFNIFLGHMSFIGPRPESFELSKWYEKDVPFFAYRHVVRPGISGWAQVEQGYAAEVDGMKVKLEYDFYYIKNFSFWLDLLITFKTIKTIITGFGAR